MKLFVPNCKTELILTRNWTFRLYFEGRCDNLLKSLGLFGGSEEKVEQHLGATAKATEVSITKVRKEHR